MLNFAVMECLFDMATIKIDTVKPELLRWAFERAGYDEERAVGVFPRLTDWLSGSKFPTMAQLQDFSSKFHAPFGMLFLDSPPVENIPIPMFRGTAGDTSHFDLDVYDTVLTVQNRQEWLEEYLTENEIGTCPIVNIVTVDSPTEEAVAILRSKLTLAPRWAFSLSGTDSAAAVNLLTERLEQTGIFVAYNGVVGNNTHRKLKVSECRGFALVSNLAPYVFVNSSDSKSAQLFTLVHETAHIMLGKSAGHAGEDECHNEVERYCDMVAAEFLVPAHVLMEIWNGDFKYASKRFKVSELVIARRARDLGLISSDCYRMFWNEYSRRPIMTKSSSGKGDFYLTSVKRVGRTFAIHIRNAVNSRQLSYTDAYKRTGLQGKTYEHFLKNIV